MNKIHIKARFKDEDVSSYLVRSFFFDFKSKGSIDIKDGKVDIKLACEDVPMEIIDTITYFCIIDEFHMSEFSEQLAKSTNGTETKCSGDNQDESEGETSEEDHTLAADTEDFSESEVETTEVSEDTHIESMETAIEENVSIKTEFKTVVPVESLVEPELNSVETEKTDTEQSKKGKNSKKQSIDDIDIPELKEFVQKSSTFKEFATFVAEWIDFGRRNELFVHLAIAANEVEVICWKDLEQKVFVTQSDKNLMSKSASTIFKKYSLSILSFIKLLVKYNKNFSSNEEKVNDNEISESEDQNPQEVVLEDESADATVSSDESMVKMHCIPRIQSFEAALESIDKTQPIEERVKKILTFMADGKKIENEIFIMVNTAITLKKIELSVVFVKSGLNAKEYGSSWMKVSKFINDYVQQYVPGTTVKAMVFIEELQSNLLTEEELKNL